MGDSLSDRGTFYNRYLFGIIPLKKLSGLQSSSPDGRFTNGFVWSDHLSAMIANEFVIRDLKEKSHLDPTDIADGIVNHDHRVEDSFHDAYTLGNDQSVTFNGKHLVRNYNEAGLTASNYNGVFSKSLSLMIYRKLVSTLDGMLQQLLSYDAAHAISAQQKAETLIIEWSGANDLIFVNDRPTKEAADKAIRARINNLKQLIEHGYRHFVLFNLPDLALTPRYQNKNKDEKANAHDCSAYFNEKFAEAYQDVAAANPDCSIDGFDIFGTFTRGYQNPKKYGFDADKIRVPYIQSIDFKLEKSRKNTASAAHGYMFWDDLHPTAYLHALVAEEFYNTFGNKFDFCAPKYKERHVEQAHDRKASTVNTLLVGGLAAAAVVMGLRKASSLLGISNEATTALGLGLVTLGIFAEKPMRHFIARAKECHEIVDSSKEAK